MLVLQRLEKKNIFETGTSLHILIIILSPLAPPSFCSPSEVYSWVLSSITHISLTSNALQTSPDLSVFRKSFVELSKLLHLHDLFFSMDFYFYSFCLGPCCRTGQSLAGCQTACKIHEICLVSNLRNILEPFKIIRFLILIFYL